MEVKDSKDKNKFKQQKTTVPFIDCLTEMVLSTLMLTNTSANDKYSGVPLKLDAQVTRFTFSAAISKPLELKRSYILL